MRAIRHNTLRAMLAVILVMASTLAMADNRAKKIDRKDSVTITVTKVNEMGTKRMLQSAHPVELKVKGSSLRISTRYQQLLPIYCQNGQLYVAMQLTPGVNWLSGLPSGRYRINNRTINIL